MTDFFHTLKDKATGKLYSVLDVNAAKKDLSNIGTVNVSVFTNDAGYLTAIPNTYKTKTENDGLYQAKGSYLTAVPSAYKTKTENDALYQAKGSYLTAIPSTYKTKTENDALYQAKGSYLTAIPSTYKTKTENDALYQAKGNYLTAIPNTVALKTDISSFKAPSSIDLEDLKNVSGTANTNDYLQWTGSTWEGKPLNLSAYALKANYYTKSESYTASEIDTKISGYEIKGTAYTKSESDGKYALKGAAGATKLEDLTDTNISTLTNGQSLRVATKADGTKEWVNVQDTIYTSSNVDPAKIGTFYFLSTLLSDQELQLPDDSDLVNYDSFYVLASQFYDKTKFYKIKVGSGAAAQNNIRKDDAGLNLNLYTDEYTMTADDLGIVWHFLYVKSAKQWRITSVFDWKYLPRTVDSLSNVTISSPSGGQALVWDDSAKIWKNDDVASGSNIVTYNAEWTPDLSKPIPNVIKELKKGAWIRFNGNIMELKDDGDKLTKSPDLDPSKYTMVIPNRSDEWDKDYEEYVKDEIVYHNNAWWKCVKNNIGVTPGTDSLNWVHYEGKGDKNHEDYLRLDGGKLWSNSGHTVAVHGKNVVSYNNGKLYQANGNEIGIVTSATLSSYATDSSLKAGLATKEDAVPSGSYNVYHFHDTNNNKHSLKDTNGTTLTGSGSNQIPHTDADLAVKTKRAVFDGKDNVVYDGTDYISQSIASDGTITDTTLDLATNAQVDAKIQSASSKVAITYANEEIKVKFS